ncbi:MAG TPA: aromatic amino acid lyase, partial [Myxococcaceae bacterium]|nr:aromatic amino acid lyase [Myxococcaceae bacterium]
VAAIGRLRALLAGSSLSEPGNARNLQDPLTFRSIPQILGAAWDALGYTRATIETELNSAGCNPAVVLAERRIVSVGNLDIVPVAAALDFARIALATVVTCAAERTVKLLQSPLSGLPAGLAAEPDTGEEALAEFGGAAQAIAAEARMLAHPVSFEVVSSSKAEGIEDRTTMAPLSARRLTEMADLAEGLLRETGFVLADNEGLALVNNNAFATGWAALAELAAERLLGEAEVAAALDLEAFAGNLSILHPVVTEVRPYPGTVAAIRRLRALLAGSFLHELGNARNLQDPLTFRSIPQILGAARDALGYTRTTIETELNSAGCNPAVVLAERRLVSV